MRRLYPFLLGTAASLFIAMSASAATTTVMTTEVLVLNSASTEIPSYKTTTNGRKSIEIQNLGPNAIFCAINAAAVVDKSRMIAVDGAWGLDLGSHDTVNCIAATADQLTGNATIVTQVR